MYEYVGISRLFFSVLRTETDVWGAYKTKLTVGNVITKSLLQGIVAKRYQHSPGAPLLFSVYCLLVIGGWCLYDSLGGATCIFIH